MRTCLIVMAAGLSALPIAPAGAGRTGDLCAQTVNQTLGRYFTSDQAEGAAASGKDGVCRLLAEQAGILDLVVKTIAACSPSPENRELLPAIEALLAEKSASHAAQNCTEPAVAKP